MRSGVTKSEPVCLLDAIARRDEKLGGWQRFKGFWGGNLPPVELPEPVGVLMTVGEALASDETTR